MYLGHELDIGIYVVIYMRLQQIYFTVCSMGTANKYILLYVQWE
jgi:hypothetical protein